MIVGSPDEAQMALRLISQKFSVRLSVLTVTFHMLIGKLNF